MQNGPRTGGGHLQLNHLNRSEFIGFTSGAAAAAPLVARPQQLSKG